jgi:hypothetical protein
MKDSYYFRVRLVVIKLRRSFNVRRRMDWIMEGVEGVIRRWDGVEIHAD